MQYIYKIKFPNNKVYIGKAKDYQKRWTQHILSAHKGENSKLYRAMREYGILNLEFSVIGEFADDIIFEKEKEYIALYNSVEDGYNTYTSNRDMNCYRKKTELIELFTNKYFSSKKEAEEYFGINITVGTKKTKSKDGSLCFIPLEKYIETSTEELNGLYIAILLDRKLELKNYGRISLESIKNTDKE